MDSVASQKWREKWRVVRVQTLINSNSVSVQSLSRVRLFATPWMAARQVSLSVTNSRSSLRLTSIKSVIPSSHLILCHPLLFLPPIPPSIRVFSNESTLCMRWPKYSSFSFSIIPSKEYPEYASKFGKLSSGHRTGKGQFSFQSKESQWQRIFKLLHNCTHLTQVMLRILQARLVYEQRNFRCSTWI